MQAYELDSPERLRAHLARGRQLYQPGRRLLGQG
jgi:hypothetical protein